MVFKEEIEFANGTTRIAGTLSLPARGSGHPTLITLHAAGEGDSSFALYQHLAQVLPERGVAVLLYDRRGSGRSGGDLPAPASTPLSRTPKPG